MDELEKLVKAARGLIDSIASTEKVRQTRFDATIGTLDQLSGSLNTLTTELGSLARVNRELAAAYDAQIARLQQSIATLVKMQFDLTPEQK